MSDVDEVVELDPKTALPRAFEIIKGLVELVENLHEFDACRVFGIAPGPHTDRARAAAHELSPVDSADKFLHAHGQADAPGKVRRDVERGERG